MFAASFNVYNTMKSSTKQRIQCFQDNLPKFLSQQKDYLANRKKGVRPSKHK